MDEHNRIIVSTKFAATATIGMGLLYLISRHRKQILQEIRKVLDFRNPLRNQQVEVVTNFQECQLAARKLYKHCNEYNVLGFDCEWVTLRGSRQPIALLQLATHRGYCALIRLCCFKGIPDELRSILEDDEILKVGVSPYDDARYLAYDYGLGVSSTFDLRHLAILARRNAEGLAKMSDKMLNVQLDKHWRIRCSDWEIGTLSESQIKYAANDAHVAIEIFKKLVDEIAPRKFWKSRKESLRKVCMLCQPYLEVKFKTTGGSSNINSLNGTLLAKKEKKHTAKQFNRNLTTRSKQLYDNCLLQAPDGELLCTCDRKKAEWYIMQNLAEVVSESEPYTVRLKFEPAGRAVGEVGKYYTIIKENQCVVCGRKDVYIRKNVVPREYRKHFPLVMKSHTSHDVLLLCPQCHQISNLADISLRVKLAKMCDAALSGTEGAQKVVEVPQLKQLRSAARALLNKTHKIPDERRKVLEKQVLDAYPEGTELSKELLEEASEIEIVELIENFCTHGVQVVNYFKETQGGLTELEKIWREHFLKTMQPKYLPELWSVTHNAHRLEIRAQEGRICADDMALAGLDPSIINTKHNLV